MNEKPTTEKLEGNDPTASSDFLHPSNDPARNASVRSRASRGGRGSVADTTRRNINSKLANPLAGFSRSELQAEGRAYAKQHGILEEEDLRAFELGAILAQAPEKYDRLKNIASDEEMTVLTKEYTNKWSQPFLLYLVIILCSTCAAVQGMVSDL
jgi:hypothetical protein